MYQALLFINNTEVTQNCHTISEAITYLSSQFDADKGHLGEVLKNDLILATVRRLNGITKIKANHPSVTNNLNLKLSTPIEFEGSITQSGNSHQSIGTNLKVGGSISFGNITQEN
jgi:hypothetical protein